MHKKLIILMLLLSACTPQDSTKLSDFGKNNNSSVSTNKQTIEPVAQKDASVSSETEKNNAYMKIKCLELGQDDPLFTERTTDKDWIHYNFYYSSVLDTCVAEKMIDRLVVDDVGSWHVLFDMLAPEGPEREIISHYSWCISGTNPSAPDLECTTRSDYESEKERILPDYY